MKHFSLLISLLLLLGLAGRTQVFSAGVLAGASTTQVGGDGLSGYDKIGISAGAFVKAKLSDPLQLEIDILYVNKGSRDNADASNGDFNTYVLRTNYIELPVLIKYHFESLSVHIGAGAYAAALINAEEEFNGLVVSPEPAYNSYDAGLVFAGDYYFTENVFAELRFTQSLTSARDVPDGTPLTYLDGRQYHSVIQAMIGYSF